jgi:copper chaperone
MKSTIKIKGMSCKHCVMAVDKALNGVEGVSNVKVDLVDGQASFDHEASMDLDLAKKAIVKAGYEIG